MLRVSIYSVLTLTVGSALLLRDVFVLCHVERQVYFPPRVLALLLLTCLGHLLGIQAVGQARSVWITQSPTVLRLQENPTVSVAVWAQ